MNKTRDIKNLQNIIKPLLWLIGLGIFILLMLKIKADVFVSIFLEMPPAYFTVVVLLSAGLYVLVAYRLKRMICKDIPYIKVLDVWIKSILASYLMGVRGAAFGLKVGLLKFNGKKMSDSLAGVSSELLYDIIFTTMVMIPFLAINKDLLHIKLSYILNYKKEILILTPFFILVFIWVWRKGSKFIREYVEKILSAFTKTNMPVNTALTVYIWLTNAFIVFLFFQGLGHNINFWVIVAAVCTGYMAGMLSFIPLGLGVYELTASYIISLQGVPLNSVLTIAVTIRIINILVACLLLIAIKALLMKRIGNTEDCL